MKTFYQTLVITILSFSTGFIQAQNSTPTKTVNDWSFLKNQKVLLVIFDYDSMGVGVQPNEEAFIKEEMKTHSPDKADQWLANWKGNRTKYFQPEFLEKANKLITPNLITDKTNDTTIQYTLIVKTVYTEPGWYASGMIKNNAYINVQYFFCRF